jgi:hypothetical protein
LHGFGKKFSKFEPGFKARKKNFESEVGSSYQIRRLLVLPTGVFGERAVTESPAT